MGTAPEGQLGGQDGLCLNVDGCFPGSIQLETCMKTLLDSVVWNSLWRQPIARSWTVTVLLGLVSACAVHRPPSFTASGPRTIVLDGKTFDEESAGGFVSWTCKDPFYIGPVRVEVGHFGGEGFKNLGFVLFDGGYEGVLTAYRRAGIERRWNWEENDTAYHYSFIIKTDGTGLYYDFTIADENGRTGPKDEYDCRMRPESRKDDRKK